MLLKIEGVLLILEDCSGMKKEKILGTKCDKSVTSDNVFSERKLGDQQQHREGGEHIPEGELLS